MHRTRAYLNGFVALGALVAGATWPAHAQQRGAAAPTASSAVNLDVAGIRIGMPVKEAMLALKADNPNLILNPHKLELEGFTQDLMTSLTASQMASPTRGAEDIELMFTAPPNTEALWGISRTTTYPSQERPSMDNIVAALRQKYGPESLRPGTNPARVDSMVWVFDAQGRPLPAAQAKRTWELCASLMDARFTPTDAINELTSPVQRAPECDSAILATAGLGSALINQGRPEYAVNNLNVRVMHAPMYKAASAATRAVSVAAGQARANKQADEIKKRGTPKL
jgi:hypothetical protein